MAAEAKGPQSSLERPMEVGQFAHNTRLSWIQHGLWVSALGFTATLAYGLAHGQSLFDERYPLFTATISFLCLAIVRGRPRLAAILLLVTVWLDLTITVLRAGTFFEASLVTFPVLVFASGLLMGTPGALVAAAASVLGTTAAGFLGGATLSRLALDHGREGFFLFALICCCVGTAVLTRAALLSYSSVLSRSERERIRYLGLFEELPDGILSLSDQGRIVESNSAAARMLGRDGKPLVGRVFTDVVAGFGLSAAIDLKHAIVLRQILELTVPGDGEVPVTLELTFRTVHVPDAQRHFLQKARIIGKNRRH